MSCWRNPFLRLIIRSQVLSYKKQTCEKKDVLRKLDSKQAAYEGKGQQNILHRQNSIEKRKMSGGNKFVVFFNLSLVHSQEIRKRRLWTWKQGWRGLLSLFLERACDRLSLHLWLAKDNRLIIPRAPMKGFWWHLHVGSFQNLVPSVPFYL